MKTWAIFCLGVLGLSVSFAQIYKWTDSQGVVHFSDNPHQGAQTVDVQVQKGYSTPKPSNGTETDDHTTSGAKIDEEAYYTSVSIVQPEKEATIRNNQGLVVVSAQVEPKLRGTDLVQILFDGTPLGDPQSALVFQLTGVLRGAHTVAVQLLDKDGKTLKVSKPVTFYMHQTTVNMIKKMNHGT